MTLALMMFAIALPCWCMNFMFWRGLPASSSESDESFTRRTVSRLDAAASAMFLRAEWLLIRFQWYRPAFSTEVRHALSFASTNPTAYATYLSRADRDLLLLASSRVRRDVGDDAVVLLSGLLMDRFGFSDEMMKDTHGPTKRTLEALFVACGSTEAARAVAEQWSKAGASDDFIARRAREAHVPDVALLGPLPVASVASEPFLVGEPGIGETPSLWFHPDQPLRPTLGEQFGPGLTVFLSALGRDVRDGSIKDLLAAVEAAGCTQSGWAAIAGWAMANDGLGLDAALAATHGFGANAEAAAKLLAAGYTGSVGDLELVVAALGIN